MITLDTLGIHKFGIHSLNGMLITLRFSGQISQIRQGEMGVDEAHNRDT
jgi:hypothetical protein